MVIYLLRHAQQNSTNCNVDVSLSERGQRQAALLGERMQQYPVDIVYSSHLKRAVETAEIAFSYSKPLLANHQIRKGLAEIDFGELTGQEDAVVKAFYKEYYKRQTALYQEGKRATGSSIDLVNRHIGEYFVPLEDMGYPNGEDGEMVLKRFMEVVREWTESNYEHIAVVTHGGAIRIVLSALFGGDFAKRLLFGTSLENCSITQINYDKEKNGFTLERFNDYAHLEKDPSLLRSAFLKPNK